jgi:hypothetical protein
MQHRRLEHMILYRPFFGCPVQSTSEQSILVAARNVLPWLRTKPAGHVDRLRLCRETKQVLVNLVSLSGARLQRPELCAEACKQASGACLETFRTYSGG